MGRDSERRLSTGGLQIGGIERGEGSMGGSALRLAHVF